MKNKFSDIISLFILLLLLSGIVIQIPDLFGVSDYIYQRINITSNTIIFIAIFLTAIWRYLSKKPLYPSKLNIIILSLSLIILILSLGMTIIDKVYYVNYVYSLTKINYDQLGFLSISLFSIWMVNQSNNFFSHHKKKLIFLFPFAILFIFFSMYHWPFDVLKRSLAEDGRVESIQVLFLLLSVIIAAFTGRKLHSKKLYLLSIFYYILSLSLFFIAGEEISWGQRLLGIDTPESLQTINRQGETTIHNIYGVESAFVQLQILSNIIGGLGFLLVPHLSKLVNKNTLYFLLPRGYYFFYFLPTPLFYLTQVKYIIPYIPEVVELFFYTGLLVFLFENYLFAKSLPKKSR